MKKSRPSLRTLVMIIALMVLLPANAFADSSWVWISEKRPFDILPWVAMGTILIEWLSIWLIPRTGNAFKVLGIIMVANVASFLLPYAFLKADLSWYGTFGHILDSGPHYIVSGVFLLLTLLIEMPIAYNALKKQVQDRKKLKVVIIVSNIITTAGVAIVERLITEGYCAIRSVSMLMICLRSIEHSEKEPDKINCGSKPYMPGPIPWLFK